MTGPPPPTTDRGRGARLRNQALVPGLLGGLLALVTAAQPWWRAVGEGVTVTFTGTSTTSGLAQALALVALAGWLLVLTLPTRGRQVVAVLLGLTGLGATVLGVIGPQPSAAAVRTEVREVSLADQFALLPTSWPYGYAFAGVLVLVGAVLILLTAPRWPRRPGRFARQAQAAATTSAADDPAAVWRAQDAGLDPTTTPDPAVGAADTAPRPAPDVPNTGIGDTIDADSTVDETMGRADQARPPSPA